MRIGIIIGRIGGVDGVALETEKWIDILLKFGMHKAMGFDPGGSSTLVVDGKVMNISPYNKNYEKDIYSLPPEPRFVANAIMGWIE